MKEIQSIVSGQNHCNVTPVRLSLNQLIVKRSKEDKIGFGQNVTMNCNFEFYVSVLYSCVVLSLSFWQKNNIVIVIVEQQIFFFKLLRP